MTRKALSVYMSATCALLIVAPGRFVCGIVLALEIVILMLTGTLFRAMCRQFKIMQIANPVILSSIVFATILIRQILMILMPEVALQLGFVIYIPAISTFSTVFLLDENHKNLKFEITINLAPTAFFSCYCLFFSLLRDIIGYGTISLPSFGKQIEIVLFNPERISAFSFFATIPGALILSALLLAVYLTAEKRFNLIKKAGLSK